MPAVAVSRFGRSAAAAAALLVFTLAAPAKGLDIGNVAPDFRLRALDGRELLGARRTPEVFVLDHDGRLRYHGRVASKMSSPDLKNALDALLQGRPIKPAETKAFGCAIPRG